MTKKKTATPETIESDLIACSNAFKEVEIPWVIIDGIVLGFVKINKILPQDTDLDLGVFIELNTKQREDIVKALQRNGFKINPITSDFVYARRKTKFNLWLYHKKGEFYEAFPKSTPGLKFVEKAEWYDKPQTVNFLGDKYPMPNHLEDYIECRYGKGWRDRSHTHEEWRVIKFGTTDQSVEVGQKIWLESRCGKDGDLWPKIMKIEEEL